MSKIRKKSQDPNDFARNWRNLRITFEGIRSVWKEERSFQQWSLVNLVSIVLVMIIRPGVVPAGLLIFAGILILVVELLNTAIEAVVDQMGDQPTPLGKLAKDAGSAAVALALLGFLVLWVAVLWQKFG